MHIEIINNFKMSRSDYLNALRKQQPIEELKRKAQKARRKDIFTQEDVDLACAEGAALFLEIMEQHNAIYTTPNVV